MGGAVLGLGDETAQLPTAEQSFPGSTTRPLSCTGWPIRASSIEEDVQSPMGDTGRAVVAVTSDFRTRRSKRCVVRRLSCRSRGRRPWRAARQRAERPSARPATASPG